MLHPNIGSVATSLSDLLSRLNGYGNAIRDFTGDESQKLVVFLGISKAEMSFLSESNFGGLRIVRISENSRFPIMFSIRTLRYLKKNFPRNAVFTLIGGDLRASLVPLFLAKYGFRTRPRIQISIHGAANANPTSERFRNYLKKLITSFAISNSDSIRVVSQHLRNEVIQEFPNSKEKVFVAPIPISTSNYRVDLASRSHEIRTLAIVGRLHPERGVIEALEYCANILASNIECKLMIIGEGTSSMDVQYWIENSGLADQIQVIGALNQDELFDYWGQIDLLVSNAPSEGYGMTIREAGLSGCRVLARKNQGTIALENEYSPLVSLFENAADFQNKFNEIKGVKVSQEYVESLRQNQVLVDKNSLQLLVKTWLVD